MATAFGGFVRRQKVRTIVVHNGRELSREQGQAVVLDASLRFMAQRNNARLSRKAEQITGDRASVQRAMLAVEDRIVRAFWVLARLPNDKGIGYAKRNGIDYMVEWEDRFTNAVAAGGKWDHAAPKPSVPSGREIDAMYTPLEWLGMLDRDHARILAIGAQWKRGESCRRISWPRARDAHKEIGNLSTRTLQRRYSDAIRMIVTELTHKRLAALSSR